MDKETKDFLKSYGLLIAMSAVSGFGLGFTALSPLVVGGIVGWVFPILVMIFYIGALYNETLKDLLCKKETTEDDIKRHIIGFGIATVISAIAGIGLGAAANALFPGAILGAALVGAVIGACTQLVSLPAARLIIDTLDKYKFTEQPART
ncbi:DUF3482 domain-containing protein [Wolbachia endosymbiont of Chironomus riparius]|uniref:DUF3482 domain-containing protein n=1 Tax=Wolbachia endosymbiont of Chironomus riparius TaxID=2883238 RepID=UPI00209EF141|nr:DUF3482 domain-containing protein [Wolbachia endosymbiont of Chironomus riparius]